MNVEDIAAWGTAFYPITFAWTFLEGETFVIFGGMAARMGILRVDLLIACAWLGSFCGDQVWFWLGRRYGDWVVRRFPTIGLGIDRALERAGRLGDAFILTYRFMYGIRNVASVALGMSSMPWIRFLALNFLGAGIWAVSFAMGGWLLGEVAHTIAGSAGLIAVVVVLIIVLVLWNLTRRPAATKEPSTSTLPPSTHPPSASPPPVSPPSPPPGFPSS